MAERPPELGSSFSGRSPQSASARTQRIEQLHGVVQATLVRGVVDEPETAQQKCAFVPGEPVWRLFGQIAIQKAKASVFAVHFNSSTSQLHDDQLPCHHPRRHGGTLGTRLRVESRGRSACSK